MGKQFKRENRYLVLKGTDLEKLSPKAQTELVNILAEVQRIRSGRGVVPVLQAVVVESDWPEHEAVWKMLEDRVTKEAL